MLSNRGWIRALRLGQSNLGMLGLFLDGPIANLGELNFIGDGPGWLKNTGPSQVCWLGPALTADSGFRGGKAEKAAEVVLTEGNLNER
jgi:hypothetical protein